MAPLQPVEVFAIVGIVLSAACWLVYYGSISRELARDRRRTSQFTKPVKLTLPRLRLRQRPSPRVRQWPRLR